jgi:hypothetical protein
MNQIAFSIKDFLVDFKSLNQEQLEILTIFRHYSKKKQSTIYLNGVNVQKIPN